jgi:hypothetical protein
MAHSREIFGIQDIVGNQTNQQKQVDETTVNSKVRRLAWEMHPDKHVNFCKTHNIEDSAGILRKALVEAVQTMQNAKDLVLCWLAIGGNGIFVDKVDDQNTITVETDDEADRDGGGRGRRGCSIVRWWQRWHGLG